MSRPRSEQPGARARLVGLASAGVLTLLYGGIAVICAVFRRRRTTRRSRRICVIGTFHNPGWYRAHITPLTRAGLDEVLLITDHAHAPIPHVRFVCPPVWLARLCTRAGAKFLWMLRTGLREKPDLYMGYHILPGAGSALVVARLLGRPAIYQMTGGPIEIAGGGADSESWVTGKLTRPSNFLEYLALHVVRQFDHVIVRGSHAQQWLAQRLAGAHTRIITGSVSCPAVGPATPRPFDLIYVGRLAPFKQPAQFLQIIATCHCRGTPVRAAILGTGPLEDDLRQQASALHIAGCVTWLGQQENPQNYLTQAKIFVLTSRSEGLSIAMAEAMVAGAVPVVADVGELSQLVHQAENGYLITPNDINQYADRIITLLHDPQQWSRCSAAAIKTARTCEVAAVAQCWRSCFDELLKPAAEPYARESIRSLSREPTP